jgi:hypothetical protein
MKQSKRIMRAILLVALSLQLSCNAPQRTFMDADLLIDEQAVPEGWETIKRENELSGNEGQESGADLTFQFVDTDYLVRGGETIYHYSSSRKAVRHYNRFFDIYFNDTNPRTSTWQIPPDFAFSSTTADQWHFACTDSTFTIGPATGDISHLCVYLAQYEEFLIYFSITRKRDDEVFIGIKDISDIVSAMDAQMATYLEP